MVAASAGASSNHNMAPTRTITALYATFLLVCTYVYFFLAEMHTSSIYTFSSMAHCFGIFLLAGQALQDSSRRRKSSQTDDAAVCASSSRRVSGFSVLFSLLAFSCRLSSTAWLNGYVPMDPSGDYFYQAVDVVAIAVAVPLLLTVLINEGWRDGRRLRGKEVLYFLVALLCVVAAAAALHGDMNDRPFYDTIWMVGALCGIMAVVPQLWKSCEAEESSPQAQCQHNFDHHAIVALCFGQMMSFTYLWMARYDVAYKVLIEDFNHPVYLLLGAHALSLRIVCDFSGDTATEAQ